MPQISNDPRLRMLAELWQAGVDAVGGCAAVGTSLRQAAPETPPTRILAVGKAACDMAAGALDLYPDLPTLAITKHGHGRDLGDAARVIEAGHPVPDDVSLSAGDAALDWVATTSDEDHLLVLVSGGASALCEALPQGMTLADWQAETAAMLASGQDIHAINTRRKAISRVKGGRLMSHFTGRAATVLILSDVPGDDPAVVGSGIGMVPQGAGFRADTRIVASNALARGAVARAASRRGLAVVEEAESLHAPIEDLAPALAARLRSGPPGLYVWGGEPTVILPDSPGRGGRNQHLALALAREIAGLEDLAILVAGTDGTDGPTQDAGGVVTGQSWRSGCAEALERADAGTALAEQGALFTTGPTGTNVMDLALALKTG